MAELKRSTLWLTSAAWLATIIVGLGMLWGYSTRPGTSAVIAASWPANAKLARSTDRPTLVMFVHPQCPCTRASVEAMARILAQCNGRAGLDVVAVTPAKFAGQWDDAPLLQSARELPAVKLSMDDGTEARRFGARTSGQVMLYSTAGRLLFHGGITPSRGHVGDCAGVDDVVSLINHAPSS